LITSIGFREGITYNPPESHNSRESCSLLCERSPFQLSYHFIPSLDQMAHETREKAGLLSRKSYDNDAASIGSSDVDNPSLDGRTSRELVESDIEVFGDDYEESVDTVPSSHRAGLARIFQLGGAKPSDGQKKDNAQQKRRRVSRRHKERRKRGEEESELMYEMEEGGEASLSPSRESSESDLHRLGKIQEDKKVCSQLLRKRFFMLLICFEGTQKTAIHPCYHPRLYHCPFLHPPLCSVSSDASYSKSYSPLRIIKRHIYISSNYHTHLFGWLPS